MPEVKKSYIVGEKIFHFFSEPVFFLFEELEKKAGQNYLSI